IFFFQAEDGIRDGHVTGVQTCALPIYSFSVAPGGYTVTATLSGFRNAAQNVEVTAGASKQIDLSLEPALAQEVTVTATKREQTDIGRASCRERVERTVVAEGIKKTAER